MLARARGSRMLAKIAARCESSLKSPTSGRCRYRALSRVHRTRATIAPICCPGNRMIHRLIPFAVALLAACASMTPVGPKVSAALAPTAGNKAAGSVTFTPNGDRVRVVAKVTGLPPGAHGFHIHEKGDCSAADGMSAGGHFNPTSKPHGNPSAGEHHGGDMTMLEADAAAMRRSMRRSTRSRLAAMPTASSAVPSSFTRTPTISRRSPPAIPVRALRAASSLPADGHTAFKAIRRTDGVVANGGDVRRDRACRVQFPLRELR